MRFTKYLGRFVLIALMVFTLCSITGCGGGGSGGDTAGSVAPAPAALAEPAPQKQVAPEGAPTATPLFMDVYGYGSSLETGDRISVADPDGVVCGEFIVNRDGQYGFLHVYGDDSTTPEDEGAIAGDFLAFYLNGQALDPGDVIWAGDGERQQVDF